MNQLVKPLLDRKLGPGSNKFELVYNPEFLRESTAVADYYSPPRIVIGTADGEPNALIDAVYRNVEGKRFITDFEVAEFTKFVDNTWHAVKVAYANEIGRLCITQGISASKIHEIFVSDTKLNVSPYYLRPGCAFGGSCLPKDVRALQQMSNEAGVNTPLVQALVQTNESHKHFIYDHYVKGLDEGASILLVGLAFKAGTDDLRESPSIDLARRILHDGFELRIFDPAVDASRLIGQNLGYAYATLPSLGELMVSKQEAMTRSFDLVIDMNGQLDELHLDSANMISVHALD